MSKGRPRHVEFTKYSIKEERNTWRKITQRKILQNFREFLKRVQLSTACHRMWEDLPKDGEIRDYLKALTQG